jgi:membrane-bound metal-dependent hydrolase YbcI (DUF457 family)
MLIRTHLAIALFFCLFLGLLFEINIFFIPIALFATIIPDIDTRFSSVGKKKPFRILQIFVKHRGFIHSLIFLLLICLPLVFFLPTVFLPFFLGYSIHIFSDGFTKMGVSPFYPFGKRISGVIKTGGLIETSLFILLVFVDLFLLFLRYPIL